MADNSAPSILSPRTSVITHPLPASAKPGSQAPTEGCPVLQAKKPQETLLVKSLKEAGAGVVGSIFSAAFTFPLDFVKTRLQVPGNEYKGTVDAFQRISKEEGFLTLYRGLSSEIIKASLQNGVYLFSYTTLKDKALALEPRGKELSVGRNLLIGILAGCVTQIFTNPLSVVQTRIMTQKKSKGVEDSLLGTAMQMFREEGIGSFFNGLVPAFVLTTNPAIQFLVYDRLLAWWKRYLQRLEKPRTPSAFELFLIGAIAKTVATIVTYPYIMAKVRLQWKPGPGEVARHTQYTGTVDVIWKTVTQDGFFGLYTGLQPQLLKSVLGSALMLMAKEKVIEYSDRIVGIILEVLSGGSKKQA